MNITFLIGNGFDLNLGLATAYSDFVKYYKETDAEKNVLIKFRQDISDNEAHWSAAEIEMGRYTGTFKTGQGEAFSECHTDFCKHLATYLKNSKTASTTITLPNKLSKLLQISTLLRSFFLNRSAV